MPRIKVSFEGRHGTLEGALELPEESPRGFALFAHCFTCGKDSIAATRISRALAAEGIGVLRFDFTGLGGSDGDFANSDFSANIDDLVAAGDFLRREYQAPGILIGHSLGGTAVLAAASQISEARAVVTIGAPASPDHVLAQLGTDLETIERQGRAEVTLGDRRFPIDRSFVEDLTAHPMRGRIRRLRRALLVMHSPLDEVVGIDEASEIFGAALHPKSFIGLDGADHLLRRTADAEFVADMIAAWSARYLDTADSEALGPDTGRVTGRDVGENHVDGGEHIAKGHVVVTEKNRQFLRGVRADDHAWLSDEPEAVGGGNRGPDPYEQLLAALGSCTSMTIRLYANRKQWPLEDIRIELAHTRDHGPDCERCEEPDQVIDVITRKIELAGPLEAAQRRRLLEIADRCPVHKTLVGDLRIETPPGTE